VREAKRVGVRLRDRGPDVVGGRGVGGACEVLWHGNGGVEGRHKCGVSGCWGGAW